MSRTAALSVAISALLLVPAAGSAAVLETLTVPAGALEVTTGKVVLKEGTAYTLKVSGTYETVGKQSGQGQSKDALFCIGYINDPQGQTCSDHHRASDFAITTIAAGPWKDIDAYGGPTQSYFAGHEYTVTFQPPATGVLRAGMRIAYTHCTTCETNSSGSITVQISGPGAGGGGKKVVVRHRRPSCSGGARAQLTGVSGQGLTTCEFGMLATLYMLDQSSPEETSSADLPNKTKKVELLADVQNPEDEKLFEEFVVAVVKARKRLKDQLDGCVVMGSLGRSPMGFHESIAQGNATLRGCMTLILREREQAQAAGTATGCGALFIPAFRKGVRPSRAKVKQARSRMEAGVRASCTRPQGTQIHMQLAGRGGPLNPVLGPHVETAIGTLGPEGAEYGDGARLQYSWGVQSG